MTNILIVENDLKFAHYLTNNISKNFKNCRICSIINNEKDAIKFINNQISDIIIIDFDSPNISCNKIFKYIKDNKIEKYSKSIIIISNNTNLPMQLTKNNYYFSTYIKTLNINKLKIIIKKILELKNDELNIRKKIDNELIKLHYNFSYMGTKYLSECIYLCHKYKYEIYNINLNKQIYPIIAEKYQKEINNIKTNIIRSTTNMYYDCKENILNNYLGYKYISKPSLKDIIYSVIKKL